MGGNTSQTKLIQAAVGVILLLVAGVAGGSIAGFRVEPEACDACGKDLAACTARQELIAEFLVEAKTAIAQAREECNP